MDKFIKRQIRQFAEDNWQTVVEKSFGNYLVDGFNSLILHMSNDLVVRLYITEPGRHYLD